MNSFSLRRTLLFSRLQAGEIFGGGIWKKLKVILVISVFIVLFSTLLNAGDISRSAGYAQTMILVMAIIPVTAILSDLISVRLLTPSSTLEKYISVYIVALSAGAAASVALALSCSTMLSLISLFSEPPAEWPVLLFVGGNFNIAYILFFGLIPLIVYGELIRVRERARGRLLLWMTIIVPAISCIVIIILGAADMLDKHEMSVAAGGIYLILVITSIIMAYRLLRKVELDRKDND
ncbi:MAG: hypothetical protein IAB82_09325 [Bacteroidetes bacterium]|uniref:Uncharacterized protein n=1 Tax=Candidatus Cryptobacteroides faecavium TaxID=2840762 RepID=A0A9D9IGE7_9BACT|nr:hypothetical protein [Candidatus Cryptobacteroides faecavium]